MLKRQFVSLASKISRLKCSGFFSSHLSNINLGTARHLNLNLRGRQVFTGSEDLMRILGLNLSIIYEQMGAF